MNYKKCPKCKETKPYSEYSKSSYRANAYCKPCTYIYNKERNEIKRKRKGNAWWI